MTIASEANMSLRQSKDSVKVLLNKDLIEIEFRKPGGNNVYALKMGVVSGQSSAPDARAQSARRAPDALGVVQDVHLGSARGAHNKDKRKGITKKDKSAAANAAPKPKRERKSKPADTTPAIPAHDYQAAFIAGFGFSDAAYRDTEFLGDIKRAYVLMDQVGLTPAAVPAFLEFVREKENGRAPKAKYLKDSVLAFEAKYSAENAYESRFFSILPNTNPEFPNGLPVGISPDEPMADVYRVQPDHIDPEWESFIASKVKEDHDFYSRFLPDTAA
jgi:hypothetical protein